MNSLHGQGLDALAPGLVVEATAPGWAFGVQWHPEWRFAENADSISLFRAFGDACRSYRTQANRKAA